MGKGSQIDVHLIEDSSTELGVLYHELPHTRIVLQNGGVPRSDQITGFRVLEKTRAWSDITDSNRIYLYPPIMVTDGQYSREKLTDDDLYPPSTGSWLSHTGRGGEPALYCLYVPRDGKDLLLVISDLETGDTVKALQIKPYEAPILMMKRDLDLYNSISEKAASLRGTGIDPHSVLKSPAPSISLFEALVGEAGVSFTYHPESFDETIDPLVPSSFPHDIRDQLKAFYAHVVVGTMPTGDPLQFYQSLSEHGLFRGLLAGHIRCMKDGIKPPPYVRILNTAASGQTSTGLVPLPGEIDPPAWFKGRVRILEQFPPWFHRVNRQVNILSESKTIPLRFPVTASDALSSDTAWRDRFAYAIHGILLRAQVRHEVLGLKYVLYMGSAYRWPHKHTAWSARLDKGEKTPWHLQVMMMPPKAVSRVKNRIPGVLSVDWVVNRVNLSHFDEDTRTWRLPMNKIYDSLSGVRTAEELRREYRIRKKERVIRIGELEAKVLGHAFFGLNLEYLEDGLISEELGVTNERIREILEDLMKKRVFTLQIFPNLSLLGNLYNVGFIARGEQTRVNSLLRAFLNRAPTATAFVSESLESAVVVCRVPRRAVPDLFGRLPSEAKDAGIELTMWPVKAYTAYQHGIFSRLLLEDGRWDDDVSGLTSQSRSRSSGDDESL